MTWTLTQGGYRTVNPRTSRRTAMIGEESQHADHNSNGILYKVQKKDFSLAPPVPRNRQGPFYLLVLLII